MFYNKEAVNEKFRGRRVESHCNVAKCHATPRFFPRGTAISDNLVNFLSYLKNIEHEIFFIEYAPINE